MRGAGMGRARVEEMRETEERRRRVRGVEKNMVGKNGVVRWEGRELKGRGEGERREAGKESARGDVNFESDEMREEPTGMK